MAKNKKSFILYADQKHIFDSLSDKEAGLLIKHIFSYVNDENPDATTKILKVAFEPIKQQLKRDLVGWETKKENRSKAGKKGMAKRWGDNKPLQAITNDNNVISAITKITVNDNVNVNGNVRERDQDRAPGIEGSNLFRKPKIPTQPEVWEIFSRNGGTKEMAKSFYDKYEGTGWYLNGSPIVNVSALASKFITNWNKNENKSPPGHENQSSAPPLKRI